MNDWRCISFVLILSVSPLLAADQFPARPKNTDGPTKPRSPDRTAVADTFRERVLVLNNGTVHRGLIEKTFAGYVLTKTNGKLVFAHDQVQLVAEDLPAAYQEQSNACPNKAAPRIELGRWCLVNDLNDEAHKEFRKALALDPNSQIAKNLLQKAEEKLLATRELPRVRIVEDGSFSLLGDAKGLATIEPLGGLSHSAAQEYSSRIQPLLVNRCAMAGCHGTGSKQEFQLHRIKIGQRAPRTQSEQNLSALLDRIDRDRPLSSPLLDKLRGEPRANGLRATHGSLAPEQLQSLRRWIISLSNKPPDVLPVSAKSTESLKPVVEDDKSTEPMADPEITDQREPPVKKRSVEIVP